MYLFSNLDYLVRKKVKFVLFLLDTTLIYLLIYLIHPFQLKSQFKLLQKIELN